MDATDLKVFEAVARHGKLGFKSAKNLQAIEVTNIYPDGFWEDQGYNCFSGS